MIRIEFPKLLAWFQTPQTVSRPSRSSTLSSQTCCGTRRTIEFFKRRKMFGIELPKVLPLFQTPLTVSRLSRPWDCPAILTLEVEVQLRFSKEEKCLELNFESSVLVSDTFYRFQIVQTVTLSSHINFGSRGSIEILKRRKMLELNFRKFNWVFQKKEYVPKICPGFTQLLPFPDCPDREIVQLYYLWK